MLKSKIQILLSVSFIGFLIWWITFQHVVAAYGKSVEVFEGTYGLLALAGSIIGFCAALKWGGFKSVLGKALLLFSLGLFAQEAGQLIGAYYVDISKVNIPYPGWDDVAFFGSTLLYILGTVYLARSVGAKLSLRKPGYKVIALIVPAVILVASYLILMHNFHFGHSSFMSKFLDVGYPVGEALYISLALVAYILSRKLLGGVMKAGILVVIFALGIQYLSDFVFIYQSNHTKFVSGSFDDLFYLIAYFVMSLGMLKFYLIYKGLKSKNAKVTQDG